MQLTTSPEKVREFLRDSEHIAQYYHDLIEYDTFEEGKAYWCRGEAGLVGHRGQGTWLLLSCNSARGSQQFLHFNGELCSQIPDIRHVFTAGHQTDIQCIHIAPAGNIQAYISRQRPNRPDGDNL